MRTPRQLIDDVLDLHQFKTWSTSRVGVNRYHASCTCDPNLEFEWPTHLSEHQAHLHAAIFEAGRNYGTPEAVED